MRRRPLRSALTLSALLLSAAWPATADTSAAQAAQEQRFDSLIKPADLKAWMEHMAAEPNQVGSPHDKANAAWQVAQFQSWGWDAHIESFDVLYPTPLHETLELTGPTPFRATLTEPPIASDPSSAHLAGALPAYVAYQGDGDVTAPLVYVNYGMPEDYAALARLGVDVRGKIVIARYGKGWRGLKPKLAQDHGAIGCIIYSDPHEDGYSLDRAYPDGPMRPPHGIQRGSVADMPLYPGDPLTPGIAPVPGAARLARADAKTILKIPTLPISYADAQVFLGALGGRLAPANFRGALPITYFVGPSAVPVHLEVKSDWQLHPIYDVIATLKGAAYPDQWVVRGNHHDGWVFGASDPLSGQVALMAEAQAIGALVKDGYRPKRTLVYASWDAEEPMLVGSTAWTSAHDDELRRHAVAYINTDGNARGIFSAEASADFGHAISQVADSVTDPETGVSVGVRARAALRVAATGDAAEDEAREAAKLAALPGHDLPVGPLGSGSDYSSFVQHLGVPAINLAFGEEGNAGGVYHSAYDSYTHHETWVDPGFVYDSLLAKTAGRLVLNLADADLPPQNPGGLAEAVSSYIAQIKKLAAHEREEAVTRAALLGAHAYTLAADPTRPMVPPPALDAVPVFDFAKLDAAAARLAKTATRYEVALKAKGPGLNVTAREKLQAVMLTIDETLAPPVGLPGRPWYKNLVSAPGRFTGYGAKTLPGVREAIEQRRWADAKLYIGVTADALDAYTSALEQAIAILTK